MSENTVAVPTVALYNGKLSTTSQNVADVFWQAA